MDKKECKYCKKPELADLLHKKECDGSCNLEVFITNDFLEINTYNHKTPYTEDVYCGFKINYCPMCGKNLENKTEDK